MINKVQSIYPLPEIDLIEVRNHPELILTWTIPSGFAPLGFYWTGDTMTIAAAPIPEDEHEPQMDRSSSNRST